MAEEIEAGMFYRVKPEQNLRILSMGKALRVTAVATSDDAANRAIVSMEPERHGVVASLGPFVFLADMDDSGQPLSRKPSRDREG